MRTTLDIQDDVLAAAKSLAHAEGSTAGAVISRLARQALIGAQPAIGSVREPRAVYGFKPFAATGKVVTNELIDQIRAREGI